MSRNRAADLLRHAARRASQHPFFLAAYLEAFRSQREMQEADLALFLGCAPDMLPKLALCRRPNPETQQFRSDVHHIARAFGIQPERLAQLIREVDALQALRKASPASGQLSTHGLLMAARDLEAESSAREEAENSADEE